MPESSKVEPPARGEWCLTNFANAVLRAWEDEMDDFFTKVEAEREKTDLTRDQVRQALNLGYGYEIGDAWKEWCDE